MSKKIVYPLIVCALVCCLSFALAACDNGGNDTPGGEFQGTLYSIQAPAASDNYTVENLPESAREGDAVSFTLTLTYPDDSIIDGVGLYGTETGYVDLTATDGVYSFTMPAEPVRINVTVTYYPDKETDNFLSWDGDNPSAFAIVLTADNPYYAPQYDTMNRLVANVTKTPSQTGGYFTQHQQTAFSLDEDVIPSDALTVTYTNSSSSNSAVSFTVCIDRTMIHEGTAKIVLRVDNGHKFGDKAILVCTVTVTAVQA